MSKRVDEQDGMASRVSPLHSLVSQQWLDAEDKQRQRFFENKLRSQHNLLNNLKTTSVEVGAVARFPMALTLCLYFTALDAWNGTAHLIIIIHPGTPLQFPLNCATSR